MTLTTYTFEENGVRLMSDSEGAPWFVGLDVCKALGIRNARMACLGLADDERDDVSITDAIGRSQQTTIISEPGLYRLIFKSRKPAAERFKRWVCHEVLPSIRRTGAYAPARDAAAAEEHTILEYCREVLGKGYTLAGAMEIGERVGQAAARLGWKAPRGAAGWVQFPREVLNAAVVIYAREAGMVRSAPSRIVEAVPADDQVE